MNSPSLCFLRSSPTLCYRCVIQTGSWHDVVPGVHGEVTDSGEILHGDEPRQSRSLASGETFCNHWHIEYVSYSTDKLYHVNCIVTVA